MSKKDGKLLLIGVLLGIILTLVAVKVSDVFRASSVEMDENFAMDDYSSDIMDEGDPAFDVVESTIEAEDIANP